MSSFCDSKTIVTPEGLREAVADLRTINFWVGFSRFSILGVALCLTILLAWMSHSEVLFLSGAILCGIVYACWLICTHDMIHHTLLGRPVLEEVLARLIAWPMLWPVGVYAELHRLHNGWNGLDLRDPERVQWTESEYQQAPPWTKFYVRHQWIIDMFVLGGWGLIIHTFIQGYRCRSVSTRLKKQISMDVLGMVGIQTLLITFVVVLQISLLRYLLFWLLLERTIGLMIQTRGHLEHYGLWGKARTHLLTQLYASRNLMANSFISWIVGGLNYHAVHHAYPDIPFNKLPTAHDRIQALLKRHGMPQMDVEQNYISTTLKLMRRTTLISSPNLVSGIDS